MIGGEEEDIAIKDSGGMEGPGVDPGAHSIGNFLKSIAEEVRAGFMAPGREVKGEFAAPPEKPGQLSEEDIERARMASGRERHAIGQTSQLMFTVGIGMAPRGAAGAFGGKLL